MSVNEMLADLKTAKPQLIKNSAQDRQNALKTLAKNLAKNKNQVIEANKLDVNDAKDHYDSAYLDRMTFDDSRFQAMIDSVEQIAKLPDIIGEVYDQKTQYSGIKTSKMRVPIGTILMIYESRPNVTIDAAALAIKTANCIILKGGKETNRTNKSLSAILTNSLKQAGTPENSVVCLIKNSREIVDNLLVRTGDIDLVIPRGSKRLLESVSAKTNIPTLLHLEGNCHVYIDSEADLKMAASVAIDSKTQRFGTCNTAESFLIHKDIYKKILPDLAIKLSEKKVEIRGDAQVCELLVQAKPAKEADWSEEYLAPIVAIKIVDDIEQAIEHINSYGSGHTDAIITENKANAAKFLNEVESSSVMHNTSTRLADGFEYGLGAEIGISTGKLHARGPVGQEGLTTYKWIVQSDGVTKGGILGKA